ncbi:hypothetical protein [Sphingomonas oligophenolica]|uniref:Methyltransferase domain-containing protein n=1 Tax=Sphingomonas oligophenolica TaxID=301154 RepID=A0A502C601_9SPHN|nr:hypothetical protein [Sphingomonas oligophenolica]TPG08130.1 hypothetical protein EAH84_14255 [Sphingomonas oligophenolica]
MGIEIQSIRLLLLARELGIDFADTLTIGRQNMMVREDQVASAFADFDTPLGHGECGAIAGVPDPFSTAIFTKLGARRIAAMDISDYEGASVIHDLNAPLAEEHQGRFSLVFDGGTLEHVFNCPTALASYMKLPRVGGHLIVSVPSNNEMGHGFYQFSPEFFFRTLSPENGYAIRGLFLAPVFTERSWLMVRDPERMRRRVGYNGWRMPTYIFVIAERLTNVTPFTRPPQQSDYAVEWESAANGDTDKPIANAARVHSLASLAGTRARAVTPGLVLDVARQVRERLKRPDAESLTPLNPRAGSAAQVAAAYR